MNKMIMGAGKFIFAKTNETKIESVNKEQWPKNFGSQRKSVYPIYGK